MNSPGTAPAGASTESERLQAELYAKISEDYEKHYDDECSQRYRREFIYEPLFRGVPLAGADVLEAMCGSGQATGFLLEQQARVTGLDIAEPSIASFGARWPGARGICASILESGLPGASFDVVLVIGGLHHLHPDLDRGVREIARLLRPGGHFLFVEPHAGSLPDVARKVWYKLDRFFAENEASVDVERMFGAHEALFQKVDERYFGTIAYMLVFHAMLFRIPAGMKAYYAAPLFRLERLLRPLESKRLSCLVAGHWIRRPGSL